MFSVHEAVARFFPAGASYDRKEAERLIRWLDSCGYAVVPKDEATSEPTAERPLDHSERPTAKYLGADYLRLVK